MRNLIHRLVLCFISFVMLMAFSLCSFGYTFDEDRELKKKQEIDSTQKEFQWWPTDAKPSPQKDENRSGYWWWPKAPGEMRPWGNRGYVYVYKILFDYKEEELPPPKPEELRPSLLIKKIVKNVKIYFDFDRTDIRDDAADILDNAVRTLNKEQNLNILVTGNCDVRGSENYNDKLGRRRAESVKAFMIDRGISEDRIKIISRGKLDAVAHVTDIVGMQKDRNAQFMIAEVEEVMIPYPGTPQEPEARAIEEGKFIIETEQQVESQVKVATREYVIKKGDTLAKIAKNELGSEHRWKYIYELNKKRIKNPNKIRVGQTILIPIE